MVLSEKTPPTLKAADMNALAVIVVVVGIFSLAWPRGARHDQIALKSVVTKVE